MAYEGSGHGIVSQQLLLSIAEELKLPLLQIARQAEQGKLSNSVDLALMQNTADTALRLLDNYALGVRLALEPEQLALESISVSSVLYDSGQQLDSLAIELGEWVISSALTQVEEWKAAGLSIPVSVNIGARQLQQQDFVERLLSILAVHPGVKPSCLELEVLETSALEDVVHVSKVIDACRKMGVMFALDDFGTGYSSLTYLKRLPVAMLKIDQSFVRDMLDDPDDLSILKGVVGLASAFHLQVIAEGVETVEHGAMLLQLGCELAQGYGIARPMPGHLLANWAAVWWRHSDWSNLPLLSQADLPRLFASVELRSWTKAIESYLKGERSTPPLLNQQQSHFDQWLKGDGLSRHGQQPSFARIAALHQQMRSLTAELYGLCELQGNGKKPEALARLGELYELQDALLAQLPLLMADQGR